MAVTTINTTYFKLTENIIDTHTDYFVIYPFDAFGNLYKRIQIDIDIPDWNGNAPIFYMPEISTLNFNFDTQITFTNYTQPDGFGSPNVIAGNNVDFWWYRGFIVGNGSMVWTPQSYNPSPVGGLNPCGSWCVVPDYQAGAMLMSVNAPLDEVAPINYTNIDWSLYQPKTKKKR